MKFEIGEIAIYQNIMDEDKYLNGEECEIIGPLNDYGQGYPEYDIRDKEGEGYVSPKFLRKKKPPNQDITETREKGYDHELTPWSPPKRETVY